MDISSPFELWTLIPPGGWLFFLFFLALIGGVLSFDFQLLKRYMRWVVLISAALFWVQFSLKLATGSHVFCFVPNLTGAFTYEGMSYAELVTHQMSGPRPCSIFLEPSYMAYYYVSYLALIWFETNKQEKWLNKEGILIIFSLVALKSGSGMVGLVILFAVKMFSIFWNANIIRRFIMIMLFVPLTIALIYMYVGSEMGQEMLLRTEEFSTEGASGFTRVVGGYLMFDQLTFDEQIIGIPDARNRFGIEMYDGNFIFTLMVYKLFYYLLVILVLCYTVFLYNTFRNTNLVSRMCIIILFVMGLLESNYLNPYMMLLTIIPCADYHFTRNRLRV